MAIKWGSYDNHIRVGIDLSVSGTTITAKYYVGTDYSGGVSDDEVLTLTGSITGSVPFHNSSSDGSPQLVATRTRSGSRGTTYSFGAKLSGVYNGATPSVSDSIKVPAAKPSRPAKPTISSITSTSANINWSKPAGNGDAVDKMQVQCDNSSGFGSPTRDVEDTASPTSAGTLTPNTKFYARTRAHNEAGWSDWSPVAEFTTKVQAPAAPSIGTPVRNSDTSITVKWSRNATTARPYTNQEVYRRYYTGSGWSSWTRIASVGSTATSYTWTSASQGHVYQFLVKAINSAGTANSSDSGNVYTTPDAPTSVKATKNAAGNIVLTWAMNDNSGSVGPSIGFDIQESQNGSSTWTTRASGVAAKTWTHTAPSATVTHQYRVRTRIVASGLPGSGLASGYVNSGIVQLLAAPNAPTGLKYDPPGIVDRTLPITLLWTHNPVDSSDQTKFQVRHRALGDTVWTTVPVVNSDVSSWVLPEDTYLEATQVEWQVMTWGLHPTGSPWSATNTISLSTKPDLTLDAPAEGEVIATSTLTPSWTFADAEGEEQVGWEITLTELSTGNVLETRVGADAATEATFSTRLADGGAYQVDVRVKDQSGLWSFPQSATVTVEYALPPAPVITGTIWDQASASVDVQFETPAPGAGQVPVDHYEVWRRIDDGGWLLLTDQLPGDATNYLDPVPTVIGRNTYLVVAVSDIPSESQAPISSVTRTNHALNPGAVGPPSGSTVPLFATWVTGAGEVSTTTVVDSGLDGPMVNGEVLGYARRTITTPKTSGSTGWQATATGLRVPLVGTADSRIRVSVYLRLSAATDPGAIHRTGRLRGNGWMGGSSVNTTDTANIELPLNEWVRLDVPYVPTGAFDTFGWWFYQSTGSNLPAGATLDATALLIEESTELLPFFYGDTQTGPLELADYEWVGTPNASKSSQTTLLPEVHVDVPEVDDTLAVWLNPASAPELGARIFHNVDITVNTGLERVLNRFAGRVLPVESTGIGEETFWQVTGVLRPWFAREVDPEGMQITWEQVARTRGPHLLRAPDPELYTWVSLSGFNIARAQGGTDYTVSFTATKVSEP